MRNGELFSRVLYSAIVALCSGLIVALGTLLLGTLVFEGEATGGVGDRGGRVVGGKGEVARKVARVRRRG